MKKIINILIIIILTLLVLNCNCYAFDFEFNSNTYSINRDISSFPTIYEYSSGSFHFSKYILILNCENNTLDLIAFPDEKINVNSELILYRKMDGSENSKNSLRYKHSDKMITYSYIYSLDLSVDNSSWVFNRSGGALYEFPTTLGNQVFLYKSEGITIDSSVYDLNSDGSITEDYIYKKTEITPEGYTYKPVEIEKEITIKDIYNSLNILIFIVTVLFVYLFIKSILRVRG